MSNKTSTKPAASGRLQTPEPPEPTPQSLEPFPKLVANRVALRAEERHVYLAV